jgi:hypothetical protein
MATRTNRTDRAREAFIEALRETCNVSHAARVAGVGRRTVYDWRDTDPEFAAEWAEAEEEAVDKLEQVARERAIDGSDKMMEILLKAHRPDKYVERRLLGSDPANPLPANAPLIDASRLSTPALQEVLALAAEQQANAANPS